MGLSLIRFSHILLLVFTFAILNIKINYADDMSNRNEVVESTVALNDLSDYDTALPVSIDDILLVDVEGLAFRFNRKGQLKWTSRLANKLISFNFHAYKHPKFSGRRRYLSPTIDGRVCYVDESRPPVCLPITVKDIVNFTPFTTPLLPSVYLVGNRVSTILSESSKPSGTFGQLDRGSDNINVIFEAINSPLSSQRFVCNNDGARTIKFEKCLVDNIKIPFRNHLEDSTQEYDSGNLEPQFDDTESLNVEQLDTFSEAKIDPINSVLPADSIQINTKNHNIKAENEQLLISTIRWTVDAYDMTTHLKLWSFTWTEIGGLNGSPDKFRGDNYKPINIKEPNMNEEVISTDQSLPYTELTGLSGSNLTNYGNLNRFDVGLGSFEFILNGKKAILSTTNGTVILSFPFTLASSYNIEKLSNSPAAGHRNDYTISLIKFAENNDDKNPKVNALTNISSQEPLNNSVSGLLRITSVTNADGASEPVETWIFNLPANITYETLETGIVKSFTGRNRKRIIYSDYIPEDLLESIKLGLPPLDYIAWAWFCLIIAYLTIKNNKLNDEITEFDQSNASAEDDNVNSPTKSSINNVDDVKVLNTSFLENGRFSRTFSCERLLGRGGFGAVYRAKHKLEPGNPEYAIKFVLLRVKSTKDLTSRRCFREVAANRDIYSKYVVRYYTWWCEDLSYLPLTDKVDERAEYEEIYQLMKRNVLFSNTGKSMRLSLDIQAPTQDSLILFDSDSDSDFNDSKLNNSDNANKGKKKKNFFDHSKFSSNEADPSKYLSDEIIPEKLSVHKVLPYEFVHEVEIDQTTDKKHGKRGKQTETPYQSSQIVLVIQMELCKGCTLRQWLDCQSRPTTYSSAALDKRIELHLFIQLVKGLKDIHERGFIHRDIKPENIFVDPQICHLKIGDFGLVGFMEDKAATAVFTLDSPNSLPIVSGRSSGSKKLPQMDSLESSQLSIKGHVIGTPEYAAPEGGAYCTDKADIYSASLILLEMLCPRFTTIMERVATLEGFRRNKKVPRYIIDHMIVWYELMISMSNDDPKCRPSAKELYRKIRSLHNSSILS